MGIRHSRYEVYDIYNAQQLEDVAKYCDQNDMNELTLKKQELETERDTGGCVESSEDTLARARKLRQSTWEVEVSFGGEVDLHHHLDACEKNPGHIKFIPVENMSIDLLPKRYQDNDLVDFIRSMSDLTVRVAVKYVSENRPSVYPGSNTPFPCYSERGVQLMRTGTGWVYFVQKFSSPKNKKTCSCRECLNSSAPKKQYARIYIKTVNHVVFDELEGAHTTCHLFFDKGSTVYQCSEAVALMGMTDIVSDVESDTCQMTYMTHDMNLADRLLKTWQKRREAHEKLMEKYGLKPNDLPMPSFRKGSDTRPKHTLTVIVSHPHGCSKQVSIGDFTKRLWVKSIWSRYNYTTATCSGSSGALVFVLGSGQLLFDHAHGGVCAANKQVNYSSYGLD